MQKRTRKYRLFGNVAYMFGAALIIASLLVNAIPPRAVSAHHPQLSGQVACQPDGTKLVTWTINNWSGTSLAMTITGINRSIGVSVGTVVQTSVQGTETFPGNAHGNVTLTVSGSWPNDATGTTSRNLNLGGNTCPQPPPPPPVDVCPNIEGNQASVPEGMELDEQGNCVPIPPPPPVDVCPNIEGNQASVPEGMELDEQGNCVLIPPPPPDNNYQLNLSHIACVDDQVEIHFVLLFVPNDITPGTLTYTYGTITPGPKTGNTWHYYDYQPDGYYDIQSASVEVDGVTVTLHNPGEYADDYQCGTPPPERITICYDNVTMTVNVDDLDQYPGYTEGECPPPAPAAIVNCFSLEDSEFRLTVTNNGAPGEIGYSTNLDATIHSLGSFANGESKSLEVPGNASTVYLYGKPGGGDWGSAVSVSLDKSQVPTCEEDPIALTFFCTDDEENPSGWLVENLNNFDITITWEIDGGPSSGGGIFIPIGGSYSFSTPYYPGAMRVYVDGILLAQGFAETCEPELLDLSVVGICVSPTSTNHGWQVSNPNSYQVEFEWRVNGSLLAGLLNVGANSTTSFQTPKSEGSIMMVYVGGALHDEANAVVTCVGGPPPELPPPPVVNLVPPTGGDPVLIPVTGIGDGDLSDMLPGAFINFGLVFFGLGMVLHGMARRRDGDVQAI